MSTQQDKLNTVFTKSLPPQLVALYLAAAAGVAVAGGLLQADDYWDALIAVLIALGAGFLVYAPLSPQAVLIFWFATTPLLSFYIRFPVDRSIVTYDRVVFGSLVLALIFRWRGRDSTRTDRFFVTRFEIAWGLLALLALVSAVTKSINVAYATRIAVDTFLIPLVAFHIAKKYIDLHRAAKPLFLASMIVAVFLFVTGAFEFLTGIDLFAFKGAELVREGERRVNGPFAADSSFAVICLLLFLFLLAAPRIFRLRLERTARFLYAVAMVSAALATLLTLFRTVAIALIVCWTFIAWSTSAGAARKRLFAAGVISAVVLGVGLSGALLSSSTLNRITSARTAYGRLATWQAAAELTLANPGFGVGLNNYAAAYDAAHYYADEPPEEVFATKAVDSPHSNILWISSELGLTGLALYILAIAYLLLMCRRAFKNAEDQLMRGAALCLAALAAAYCISGLTLTSGYYSDLNLCFFFLAGVLSSGFAKSSSHHRSMASHFAD